MSSPDELRPPGRGTVSAADLQKMAMTLVQDRVGSQYRVRIAERLVGSTALKQADKLLRPMLMAARPENTEAQIVLYVPDSPGTAAIEQTLIGPASATVSYSWGSRAEPTRRRSTRTGPAAWREGSGAPRLYPCSISGWNRSTRSTTVRGWQSWR